MKFKKRDFKKRDYWIIPIGAVTGYSLFFYGSIKPDSIFVVGGITILLLTWLHWKAIKHI